MRECGGIHILNFKSLQFLFPRKQGLDVAFHKLTEVLSTDAAQEVFFLKKKKKERRSLVLVFLFFLLLLFLF